MATDPTIAHAGMTEIDAEANEPVTNGASNHVDTPTVPDASNIDAGAANAAATTNWDAAVDQGADSWVEVPRDLAETDTGVAATPAAMAGTQSWAEDVPAESAPAPVAPTAEPKAAGGDGFHEVHHGRGGRGRNGSYGEHHGEHRGSHRGRGGFRGDRGGDGGYREGGYRGRGSFRGDRGGGEGGYRGRGRGGFRGNRGRGEGPPPQ